MLSAEFMVRAFVLAAGAALGAALLAGASRATDAEDRLGVPFAWTNAFAFGYFFATAMFYNAHSLAGAESALRAQIACVVVTVGLVPWCFARMSRLPLAAYEWLSIAAFAAGLLVVNQFSPASLRFDAFVQTGALHAPGGALVPVFRGHPGPGSIALRAYMLLLLVWIGRRAWAMWRAGERTLAWWTVVNSALLVVANAIGTLADIYHLRVGYLTAIPVLISLIVALGVAIGIARRSRRRELAAADAELRATNAALQDEIRERTRLERRLIETQRMEALGRMAAGVAHDFNNVITVLRGHADLIVHATGAQPGLRASAEEIGRAADNATSLTRQLLAFARQQSLAPRALDPDRALAELASMVRPLVGHAVELVLEPGAQGRAILADPTQFSQVILNLAANARDAMPDGGRLTIATTRIAAGAPGVCACEGVLAGGHVGMSVADTGSGMDAETLARAFEPFYTTKSPERGTGLGLATVHGIVRQSGGFIAVSSQPGAGTTFRICWPEAPPREPLEPRPSSDAVTTV
ncbi:MAG TPA: ATP-binding protein [Candidatus Acidoferrales bacterium]|nr:ATP-binding protein [Candidatus Acidoferrales bacterium]